MLVNIVADLQVLDKAAFWVYMDNRACAIPTTTRARSVESTIFRPRSRSDTTIPYRSLAGELRQHGATPRTIPRSASSSGPTFCGGGSSTSCWKKILTPRFRRRLGLARASAPATCGVVWFVPRGLMRRSFAARPCGCSTFYLVTGLAPSAARLTSKSGLGDVRPRRIACRVGSVLLKSVSQSRLGYVARH